MSYLTVPPARQRTLAGCERAAVDPTDSASLCEAHLERTDSPGPPSPIDDSRESTDTPSSGRDANPSDTVERGAFPEDLATIDQWLTWTPPGVDRTVPRAPSGYPDWPEKLVSPQDPESWTDFATAIRPTTVGRQSDSRPLGVGAGSRPGPGPPGRFYRPPKHRVGPVSVTTCCAVSVRRLTHGGRAQRPEAGRPLR